jgi:hypothetical protein
VTDVTPAYPAAVIVYAVVDDALSPDFPLGVEFEVFVRREDAERFVEEVRGDDPEVASYLRIEERERVSRGARASASAGALPVDNRAIYAD